MNLLAWWPVVAAAYFLVFSLWLLSLHKKDASIIDAYWGPGFLLVTAVAAAVNSTGYRPRQLLVLVALGCWGLRLGLHLLQRNRAHGEDRRYQAMRASIGPKFWWVSLFSVFLLQATLQLFIAWPLLAAVHAPGPELGFWDLGAVVIFAIGWGLEAIADRQLARFLADPTRRGQVLDTGLWRYSRHPNYFGDALLWWGLGAFGLAVGQVWSLLGPAVMTFLLLKVSGVSLLEKTITQRRPEYEAYRRRTSAFVPWPPRAS